MQINRFLMRFLNRIRRKSMSVVQTLYGRKISIGGNAFKLRGLLLNPLYGPATMRTYEPWLDNVLGAALKCRPGAFVEVGVNMGQTFFQVLPFLGKEREYLGFEPQIICCFSLCTFIEDNRLIRHRVFPFGLSNVDRVVKLYMRSGDGDTTASMVEAFRPDAFYRSYQYIPVRKGDDVLREIGTEAISVIKIDVEGGELEVIEGFAETIIQKRPILIFEVLNNFLAVTNENLSPATIRFRQERLSKMESALRTSRYQILSILPGDVLKDVVAIEPRISADLSLVDYLAIPEEFLDSFLYDFPGRIEALGRGRA